MLSDISLRHAEQNFATKRCRDAVTHLKNSVPLAFLLSLPKYVLGVKMNKLMKLVLFASFFGLTAASAYEVESAGKVKITTSQYTCSQVVDILREYRSVWVRGFLGTYGNVAATPGEIAHCDGPTRGERHCNIWTPNLKTKDGTCRVGVRCTCFSDERGRDN